MALDVEILGGDALKRVAAQIKASGDKGLGTEMGKALRKAAEPVQKTIRVEYGKLPARGGYAALFSKSLRFRTSLRAGGRQASFRLLTFADGKNERRDINRLERGELRHPVFGRRKSTWQTTRVAGNFHQRGTDQAADDVENAMREVVKDFAQRMIK